MLCILNACSSHVAHDSALIASHEVLHGCSPHVGELRFLCVGRLVKGSANAMHSACVMYVALAFGHPRSTKWLASVARASRLPANPRSSDVHEHRGC